MAVVKSQTPTDHEWAKLYDSLVVVPMIEAPQDRKNWRIFDPDGILERLETAAIEHGLMDASASPEMIDPALAIATMLRVSGGLKELPG